MDSIDKIIDQWATEKPELDTEPMSILGRMMRLFKYLEAEVANTHKAFGLKLGEFDVLATLRRSGSPFTLTPSEMMNSVMLTSGAMTNRLDRLEDKELIQRQHSESDRRSVSISLTPKGLDLIEKALLAHVETQHRLTRSLNKEQKETINSLFKQWLDGFEPVQK
ncbi:MarR family winged helix-turn-helix transcriptional regulator [Vibrio viridaestus]|uniref:MarR family transcriptional regulator n=1 Tax=Vibrio viridaestus TaxID=2487322 RepID=A0A3N9TJF3_9VIBR|nr:MarR family transcriptional regulator [Vibrio viridaestus]RQW64439.1 MarR family transcriptional regulator [Vibrio viridaestus]